jgi:hypothetical protein
MSPEIALTTKAQTTTGTADAANANQFPGGPNVSEVNEPIAAAMRT